MTIRTGDDYGHLLQAVGVCLSTRIPVLLWGSPGEGKTAVVESAADQGWCVETLILSHYEPSDFTGLPVVAGNDTVTFAPPAWATRLADESSPAIVFFDELTTASPAVQAAALRTLTHGEVGTVRLPDTVAFAAAANPADMAAAGWELTAPTASRFVHLDWLLPLEVYAQSTVTGSWPTLPVYTPPGGLDVELDRQRALISGFLYARPALLSAVPDRADERGRAFPTPRTWDYAARLAAFATAVGAAKPVVQLLVAGCVGPAAAHEYLAWAAHHELPDPEQLLDNPDPAVFVDMRPDRVYVTLQAVLAAVARRRSRSRWTAAVTVCCHAAVQAIDPAVPVIRGLLAPGMRPPGADMPADIAVFKGTLALAGLL